MFFDNIERSRLNEFPIQPTNYADQGIELAQTGAGP